MIPAEVVSEDNTWSAVQVTGVLMVSVPDVEMVTLLVYQPLAPKVPDAFNVADGGVESFLTVTDTSRFVNPASFVHEPENMVPVVSVNCVWTDVHVTGLISDPEVVIVTVPVNHPCAPAVPVGMIATLAGGVASY